MINLGQNNFSGNGKLFLPRSFIYFLHSARGYGFDSNLSSLIVSVYYGSDRPSCRQWMEKSGEVFEVINPKT